MIQEDARLAGLDEIPWARLQHVYGPADDVPGWVREAFAPTSAAKATSALQHLSTSVYHQGGQICAAAPPLLPYLLTLGADVASPVASRIEALHLVSRLAESGRTADPYSVAPDWHPAWRDAFPVLLGLLDDNVPEIRRIVVGALAEAVHECCEVRAAVRNRFTDEPDEDVRLAMIRSVGHSLSHCPWAPAVDIRWLNGLTADPDPRVRLTAVLGLRAARPAEPDPDHFAVALAALSVADVAERYPGHFVTDAAEQLGPDRQEQVRLALSLLGHPSAGHRAGALRIAVDAVSRWRSAAEELLPAVAERLADPEPDNRVLAAHVMAAVGEDAAPWADELAPLIEDPYAPAADAAVWALSRCADPRCVAPLLERLRGERPGFASYGSAGSTRLPWRPSHDKVIAPLRAYADDLLPALRQRLCAAEDFDARRAWIQAIAALQAAAAPARPELVAALTGDAAAWALYGLAETGAEGVDPALLRGALEVAAGDPYDTLAAVGSYYRITRDPQPALDLLRTAADPLDSLTLLAELGPAARAFVDVPRAVLRDKASGHRRADAGWALWRITGDPGPLVPFLEHEARRLAPWSDGLRLRTPLARIAEVGLPAAATAEPIRAVLSGDRRVAVPCEWQSVGVDAVLRRDLSHALKRVGG